MTVLTLEDHRQIHDTIGDLYALQDVDSFVVTAMQALPAIVGSDVTSFNEINIPARRMVAVNDDPVSEALYLEMRPQLDGMNTQNPLIAHYLAHDDKPLRISDFLPLDAWQRTRFHREFFSKLGLNFQTAVVVRVDEAALVAFAFNRKSTDFSGRDTAVLAAVQPHLRQAYRNAVQYTDTLGRLDSRDRVMEQMGLAWIDLDDAHQIVQASETARSGLSAFFEIRRLDPVRLPAELETWVTANEQAVREGGRIEPFTKHSGRDRLTFQLVPNTRSAGVSLLVERYVDAPSAKPLEALGLTKRQAEILYWIAQGKSNPEIAVIEKLSLRTVENHVSRMLATLGAANRTEAAVIAIARLSRR